MSAAQQTFDLATDASAASHAAPCSGLRERYLEAIKGGYWPWAERHPRNRFSEYDQFRAIWMDELWHWLFGENPRQVYSLTAFAWKVQHDRMSEGGCKSVCLNWSDRNQRVYLGDGLLEYLGLLKDEIERVYGQNAQADRMTTAPTTPRLADNAQRGSHSVQRLVREFVDARLADCMEVMAEYPDGHFDLAIVDPPYGINVGDNKSGMGRRKGDAKAKYKMGDWDSAPPPDEYFRELRRVSKNQIIWGANHYIERMAWNSPCWIIWDKLYSNDVSFAAVEMAWTSFRTTAKKFECTPLQAARIHPTQKPVKLYDWLLANYAKPGQRILDTHMGSGSIGIAGHYYRCPLVTCEIDPDYFWAACDRIERETAQADFYLPNSPLNKPSPFNLPPNS